MSDPTEDAIKAALAQINVLPAKMVAHVAAADVGISRRDWFAGQAITAAYNFCISHCPDAGQAWDEMVAVECFAIADAMIAAQNGGAE